MVKSDPRYSQGMSWITHRPPTKEDADIDDEVFLRNPDAKYGYSLVEFDEVVLGQPWWSRKAADAAGTLNPIEQAKLEHLRAKVQLLNLRLLREQGKLVAPSELPGRKVVQITGTDAWLIALCNDGTMWFKQPAGSDSWQQLPAIPQEAR
jgi:hypothetical protein